MNKSIKPLVKLMEINSGNKPCECFVKVLKLEPFDANYTFNAYNVSKWSRKL